jgi:hypothetical protein
MLFEIKLSFYCKIVAETNDIDRRQDSFLKFLSVCLTNIITEPIKTKDCNMQIKYDFQLMQI